MSACVPAASASGDGSEPRKSVSRDARTKDPAFIGWPDSLNMWSLNLWDSRLGICRLRDIGVHIASPVPSHARTSMLPHPCLFPPACCECTALQEPAILKHQQPG